MAHAIEKLVNANALFRVNSSHDCKNAICLIFRIKQPLKLGVACRPSQLHYVENVSHWIPEQAVQDHKQNWNPEHKYY
jgi:hypothetical protein